MLEQALALIVNTLFSLFILAVLVRFWMQALRAPTRNPIAQFSIALTDFAVKPLRRVVPGLFRLDLASLVAALLFEFVLQVILQVLLRGASPFSHPQVLPIVLFLSIVELVRLSIYVFMGAIIIQAVMSWVNAHHPVAPFFEALTRPMLAPLRRVVPLIGGIDLSPLFALVALQILLLPVGALEAESLRLLIPALL